MGLATAAEAATEARAWVARLEDIIANEADEEYQELKAQ